MSLGVGQPVPDYSLEAYVRGERAPSEFALGSSRPLGCPVFLPARLHVHRPTELAAFAERHEDFLGERAVVLGASTDSYYSHKAGV